MLFKKLMIAALFLAAATSCGVQKKAASLSGKKCIVIGNSMLYYGGFVQNGDQGNDDPGLLKKLLTEHQGGVYVVDCTHGGHYLGDYTLNGCTRKGKSCTGGTIWRRCSSRSENTTTCSFPRPAATIRISWPTR